MDGYFTGRYEFSIDTKGRVAVPAKFRALIGENKYFHLIRMPKYRIKIMTEDEWEKKAKIYANLPETEEFDDYRRIFYSSQADSEIDAQGRITIPKNLLDKIKCEKKIVLQGYGKHIEAYCEKYENIKLTNEKEEKDFLLDYYNIEKKIREFEEK